MSNWLSLGTSESGVHSRMKTESDGSITVVKEQDLARMVEEIKLVRELQTNRGYTESKDLQSVALIPTLVLQQWIEQEGGDPSVVWAGDQYSELVRKKLNDPANACWRTGSGQIGSTNNIRMI